MPSKHRVASIPWGTQLYLGKPEKSFIEEAWKSKIACPHARHLRWVSERMEELIKSYRRAATPFGITRDQYNRYWIRRTPIVSQILELFSSGSRRLAEEAAEMYREHGLNPYFELFREGIVELDSAVINEALLVTESHFSAEGTVHGRNFDPSLSSIEQSCLAINQNFERTWRLAQGEKFQEAVKSFDRVARERRRSLMRLVSHLIEDAPSVNIAYVTLWGNQGSSAPVSYNEISQYRKGLFRFLSRSLPLNTHLGYTFLLKHDICRGYYLSGCIYLRDMGIIAPSSLTQRIQEQWEKQITRGQGPCECQMLVGGSQTNRLSWALRFATALTEPDFFYQVKLSGGARAYFPSQSPIGKLSSRTRRLNLSAGQKNKTPHGRTLLESFKEEDHESWKQQRWEAGTSKIAEKRSRAAQKAARTRSKRKMQETGAVAPGSHAALSPEAALSRGPATSPKSTSPAHAHSQLPSSAVEEINRNDSRKKVEIRKNRVVIVSKP